MQEPEPTPFTPELAPLPAPTPPSTPPEAAVLSPPPPQGMPQQPSAAESSAPIAAVRAKAPAKPKAPEPPPKPQRPKIKIRMTERAKQAMAAGRPAKVHPAPAKPGIAAANAAAAGSSDADQCPGDAGLDAGDVEAGRLGGIGQGVPETVQPQHADEGGQGGLDAVWSSIMRQVGAWALARAVSG